jgi:hypothetical protein
MQLKKGMKVRIRQWEDMEKEFGLDEDGDINCAACFTRNMKPLCGKTIEINELDFDEENNEYCSVETDFFIISGDMCVPIEN